MAAEESALRAKPFKRLRGGALKLAARMRLYDGKSPADFSEARQNRRAAKRRDARDRALDRQHVDKTCALRASRLQRLGALHGANAPAMLEGPVAAGDDAHGGDAARCALPLIPDGVAPGVGVAADTLLLREGGADGKLCAGEGVDGGGAHAGTAGADGAGPAGPAGDGVDADATRKRRMLNAPRGCYACKRRFRELHHFYDRLCPECAALNWAKRHATADLQGRYALVTGGRVKIGFRVALRLLRCGAGVVVTTRFPADAATRFAAQDDFETFRGRLQVISLDLRDLKRVQRFTQLLETHVPHLDIVVNNACQTVRRPPAYYRHLMGLEATAKEWLGEGATDVLKVEHSSWNGGAAIERGAASGGEALEAASDAEGGAAAGGSGGAGEGAGAVAREQGLGSKSAVDALHSAALSQVPVLASDTAAAAEHFPEGAYDVNGQQVDLRPKNSWKLRLHEVDVGELLEVLAVNAASPFALNSQLKPLLLRSPHEYRFVVNVSAMEGKFYRKKTSNHPHTNMAKAALNMMTHTSAEDYAAEGIFMNSVDTGWINDENPLPDAARIAKDNFFQTPIDECVSAPPRAPPPTRRAPSLTLDARRREDAAARVLDPVLAYAHLPTEGSDDRPPYGLFWKDYKVSEW